MKEALALYVIGVWLSLLIAWPAGLLTEKRVFAYILAWPVVAVWRLYRLFFNWAVPSGEEGD